MARNQWWAKLERGDRVVDKFDLRRIGTVKANDGAFVIVVWDNSKQPESEIVFWRLMKRG